ncbi:PD-(D/E)XK nuclease family protein [soil metagenome]
MFNQLFKDLNPDTLILTANRRQAAYLRSNYDQWHLQQGHKAWTSLTIFPYSSWITHRWQQACLTGQLKPYTLLSDFQAQILWEEIISASEVSNHLLNVAPTAKLVKEAWQNLQSWRAPISHQAFSQTQESRSLQTWISTYLAVCEQRGFIDTAALTQQVISLLTANKLVLETHIILLGFDEFNPQQQQLITLLRQHGCDVVSQQINDCCADSTCKVYRLGLQNTAEELMLMARWAKNLIDQTISGRIACVIPNLNEIRPQVERCFNEVFAPDKLLNPHAHPSELFNISAGMTMQEFPLLHTALLIIKLTLQPILLTTWSTLLRSPFISAAETEMHARAKLEVKLRSYGETTLSLATLLTQSNRFCPQWQSSIMKIKEQLDATPKQQKPSLWTQYFSDKLALMGWPGERQVSSTEYQLLQRWQQLLLEFSALDNLLGEISFNKACSHLQRLLACSIFQPQSPQAPVQVLGILEAAGLPFDHLWMMGMSDINWPSTARPNPFIPISLQRQLQMPHATAERELAIAKQLTHNFSQSAANVIFSYPLYVDDRQLRPSSLLSKFNEISLDDLQLPAYQSPTEILFTPCDIMETLLDEYGPVLLVDEKFRGGAAVLKYQAACPFRAFAKLRLGAQSLDEPTLGLNALERGTLLHRILEKLWQRLRNQTTLLNLADTELAEAINDSIKLAITEKQLLRPQTLTPRFLNIEQQRLAKLLLAWMKLEKSREAFDVIATELQQAIVIADLTLQVRIDRIDQLANGDYVILDYKTGETSIYAWLGERPDEPQLPLYCVGSEFNTIVGLGFAQISAKKISLKGLGHESAQQGIPGISSLYDLKENAPTLEWELLLLQWRQTLQILAEQFRNGYAKVDPKDSRTTCNECDLQSLCRVYDTKSS